MQTKDDREARPGTPEFDAVVRTRLSDQIAGRIQDAIASEQYKPGERLPSEQSLATSFKTSRSTVREALRALQAMGFLDIRNGAGVFVADSPFSFSARRDRTGTLPDRQAVLLEILEIRLVLQGLAVKRCAQRITDSELGALQAVMQDMRDAATAQDGDRYARLDEQFHLKIGDLCDNSMLRDIVHHIESGYHAASHNVLGWGERLTQSLQEHDKIIAALTKHDEAAAEAAMRCHMQGIRDAVAALPDEPA